MDKNQIKILAVPRDHVPPFLLETGFVALFNFNGIRRILQESGDYQMRGLLENDPSYKQIIPQILWVVDNKVFVHTIPETGSENRLHKQMPIFLGGHVEQEKDVDIVEATWREFFEEAGLPQDIDRYQFEMSFEGTVNDETNEVSQVHLGLVWIARGGRAVIPEEGHDDGVSKGTFLSIEEIDALDSRLTYWSRLAWPTLRRTLLLWREKEAKTC